MTHPSSQPELAESASASAASSPDTADWSARPEAGGVRAATALVRIALRCGRRATRLLLWPATLYFALRRPPDRRASRAYLTRVYGRPARTREVMRHMHTFAAMTLDRIFLMDERFKRFRIELHGIEHLVHALDQRRGVLLLGSHHGSFDALRVLSLQRPDVRLRVLLDVGHNPAMTTLLHELNPTLAGSVIDAGQDGTAILFAIKEGLDAQALVTLLADRPRPGETTVPAMLLGEPAAFPVAPWLIASACGVPVVLCFGLYRGGNRYDLHFELYADRVDIPRRERQAVLATLVQRYAARLEHYIRLAPFNWFNFYDFWLSERVRAAGGAAAGADAGRAGR